MSDIRLSLLIETTGIMLNIFGAVFLYFSSIPKPWNTQTWIGTTPKEKSYDNKRSLQRIFGTVFLILGAICMFSYTNKLIVELITFILSALSL